MPFFESHAEDAARPSSSSTPRNVVPHGDGHGAVGGVRRLASLFETPPRPSLPSLSPRPATVAIGVGVGRRRGGDGHTHVDVDGAASPSLSLRDRVALMERSGTMTLPPPPDPRRLLAPEGDTPLTAPPQPSAPRRLADEEDGHATTLSLPPSPPEESSASAAKRTALLPETLDEKESDGAISRRSKAAEPPPMPPTEKCVVSPVVAFTPIRSRRPAVSTGASEEREDAGSVARRDTITEEKRASLLRGLKQHLSARQTGRSDAACRSLQGSARTTFTSEPSDDVRSTGEDAALGERLSDTTAALAGKLAGACEATHPREQGEPHDGVSHTHAPNKNDNTVTVERCAIAEDMPVECLPLQPKNKDPSSSLAVKDVPSQGESFQERLKSRRSHLCSKSRKCVPSTLNSVTKFMRGGIMWLRPCFTIIRNYSWAFVIYCWLNISSFSSVATKKTKGAVYVTSMYLGECYDSHRALMSHAPAAANTVGLWAIVMDKGVASCFASMGISVFTEMYPTAPSGNVFVAMLLLFFRLKPPMGQQPAPQYHSIFLIAAVLLSVFIDVDWISYKYFPDGDLGYYKVQETSIIWTAVWYAVLINLFLKLWCLNESLKVVDPGIRKKFCGRVGKCLVSSRIPEDLATAVRDKVVVLTWIELVCSLGCFGCFFVIEFDGVSLAHYREPPSQLLSLQGALLFKAASGLLVVLSLAQHIRVRDFFRFLGCKFVCPPLYESRARGRGQDRILSQLNKTSKCIVGMKALDFIIAALLWRALVLVYRQTFNPPKEVTILLGLVCATQIFTSIIASVLNLVVFWYTRISSKGPETFHQRRQRAMEGNTPASSRRMKRKRQFIASTKKRSNRSQPSPRLEDRSPPRKEGDYDLEDPRTAQTLLETRLTRALGSGLDPGVVCSPHKFQAEWRVLPQGASLSHRVLLAPLLSDSHKHFHARRFYVVGSGMIGNVSRVLIIGQKQKQQDTQTNLKLAPVQRKSPSRCLVEITIDLESYEMKADVRCYHQDEIRFFLGALDLKELFGELS